MSVCTKVCACVCLCVSAVRSVCVCVSSEVCACLCVSAVRCVHACLHVYSVRCVYACVWLTVLTPCPLGPRRPWLPGLAWVSCARGPSPSLPAQTRQGCAGTGVANVWTGSADRVECCAHPHPPQPPPVPRGSAYVPPAHQAGPKSYPVFDPAASGRPLRVPSARRGALPPQDASTVVSAPFPPPVRPPEAGENVKSGLLAGSSALAILCSQACVSPVRPAPLDAPLG